MYLSDGENKRELLTSHYIIGAPWFKYLCSIFCLVLICLWFFFFLFHRLVGLLDRLINKQIHIYTVQALQSTVICHQTQNVHIRLLIRKTQLSINQVSVYTRPKFFPSLSLICGENTYCSFFSCFKPRPFKQKLKVSEVTIQEVWRGDTTHRTHSIYVYICSVYIYTVLLSRREL